MSTQRFEEITRLISRAVDCVEKITRRQHAGGAFVNHVYPPDLSRETFLKAAAANPDLKRFDTIVERNAAGNLVAVLYVERYRDILNEMVGYLREARGITRNADFARYLDAVITWLRLGTPATYRNMMEAWLGARNYPLCFILVADETYSDTRFGLKGTFDAALFREDPTWTPALDKPLNTWPQFTRTLSWPGTPRNFPGIYSRVYAVKAITGVIRDMQLRAWNLPNDYSLRTRLGSHQVIIREHTMQAFYADLLPMIRRTFPAPAGGVTEDMLLRGLFWTLAGHELGHNLGCYDAQSRLGEREDVFEELKANIIPVIWAMHCRDMGEITPDEARAAVMVYTALDFQDCVLMHNAESRRSYCRAAMIQVNYLLRHDAARIRNGRLEWDESRLEPVNRSLLAEIAEIMAGGDYHGAGEFLSAYGSLDAAEQLAFHQSEDFRGTRTSGSPDISAILATR